MRPLTLIYLILLSMAHVGLMSAHTMLDKIIYQNFFLTKDEKWGFGIKFKKQNTGTINTDTDSNPLFMYNRNNVIIGTLCYMSISKMKQSDPNAICPPSTK